MGNGLLAYICVISIARLRLRGGHETGRPEPPSQPPTGDIVHPEFGELCLVLPGGPNVDDSQPTARAQDPYRFADCLMLWIAKLERTTSKPLSSKGSAVMSP